ncbi:HlyD family secretion protein [Neorhizobium alkalisoli]|uniref:Membrane fusion protein (Multidrug efflux system) n=1 Tax=Neorhizobium alkalisoli TaxID=528178 RepID=A0A561Q0H7_9HYPH|nr:HlyD family secretion protein [Neorhizobium alkalisoli]TWF43849.1 membrane fusion protein (multidrug efflux system) [Neorhizobium alkalisoli]
MAESSVIASPDVIRLPQPDREAKPSPASETGNLPVEPTSGARGLMRRLMLGGSILLAAAYGTYQGFQYYTLGRFIITTDDAYLKADFTSVAPKVSGYISEVLVTDNEHVKAGQVVARIDDRDFQSALSQARGDLAAAEAAIANIDAQIVLQNALIDQAKAGLASSEANLAFASSDAKRSEYLYTSGSGTLSRAEQTQSVSDQARAAVDNSKAAVVAAENKLPLLDTQRNQAIAQRDRAKAGVNQAELNLSYTNIVSAIDGTVGARTIRLGQLVSAGTQLMAVVPLNAVYVVGNFKETQLTDVVPGQRVAVKVDSFPDATIDGHVDSVSPGSGLEFSLLPADNATGNFTKIVQRIPVKIVIDSKEYVGRLRSGMSVVPSIDTRGGRSTP